MKKIFRTLLVTLVFFGMLCGSFKVASASQPTSNNAGGDSATQELSSDYEFTSIDEDGTYRPLSEDELTLDSGKARFNQGIMMAYYNPSIDYETGVVNFRTKSSSLYNTEYTDCLLYTS